MGLRPRVHTAIEMDNVAERFIRERAIEHLKDGKIVIFVAGTGNPFFSTDTTAALRANEIGAEVILKATKVDGIYTADPFKDPKATKYDRITYSEALAKRLSVMDSTAFSLCMGQQNADYRIRHDEAPDNIKRAVSPAGRGHESSSPPNNLFGRLAIPMKFSWKPKPSMEKGFEHDSTSFPRCVPAKRRRLWSKTSMSKPTACRASLEASSRS